MGENNLWHNIIDRNIKIDLFMLLKPVTELIDTLEELHKQKDWFNYDLDELEMRAKGYVLRNEISESTYKRLLEKYGGLYD